MSIRSMPGLLLPYRPMEKEQNRVFCGNPIIPIVPLTSSTASDNGVFNLFF
jgi:hypothetical protein